jgi:arylsulfatase A-like enzyme
LITGRYQFRLPVGLHEPVVPHSKRTDALPADHPTLPSLLRSLGYATSLIGKWHLGETVEHGPLRHGYDRFFGILTSAADYFTHEAEAPPEGKTALYRGDAIEKHDGYLTDLLATEAIAEIERTAALHQPFAISLHFTAPHWPWEGPADRHVAKQLTSLQQGGSDKTYAAMMQNLDANVGRVLDALSARGLADDTIVVFTSDNGGERFSDNWPFSGMKTELLEGGIRVPTLVRWPARIRAGSKTDQVMTSMDWLPTLLAAAGGAPDSAYPSDGENLLAVLLGQASPHPRRVFWRYNASDQAAVRDGNWKYLRLGGREYLFDVINDPRERANLAKKHPEVFDRLKASFDAWNATMLPYTDETYSYGVKKMNTVPDRY